ncbi:hypothetical protein [Burkholderia metallica]|uniref:hypothetical protein n=1 Tax=Burkholderia metallica TaxID=488729 RepID=UPI001575A6A9|nr:hypothetical protein [Burkholderia metallica]NTZ06316.1 hypothetical protein [Burkholderia metallica]
MTRRKSVLIAGSGRIMEREARRDESRPFIHGAYWSLGANGACAFPEDSLQQKSPLAPISF